MTQIPLDQAQDISQQETHRLTTLFPQPDFVKNASTDRLVGDDSLPKHVYADVNKRLYPCHTAPATWMSALFFADKRASFDSNRVAAIQERIHSSARYFGILNLVRELEEKVAAAADTNVDNLPDEMFAVVWTDEIGNKERHWPLRNETEVKFAADYFSRYRNEFRFADRHKIAERILKRADVVNSDLSEYVHTLEMTAGRGACAAKVAADMLLTRAKLTQRSHADGSAHMRKLAQAIVEQPENARRHETRVKLAELVDDFDRETHLNRLYDDGGLLRPEEVLFAITEKVARDFVSENIETTTGNVYALQDIEKIAVDEMRSWMGDDFTDAVTVSGIYVDREKLAAIVPTLDRQLAAKFDRMLQENKVAAFVETKAANNLLPLETLYALAAE